MITEIKILNFSDLSKNATLLLRNIYSRNYV